MRKGMERIPLRITGVTIVLASLLVCTQQQSSSLANKQIPDYLLECYSNLTLYERDMRLPATISTLISLVRKIELYPGINMDIRTFTVTLLRKFRLDGVVRDPSIKAAGIVPFGPNGPQKHRQRFLFGGLLPATGMLIPNQTLTSQEKCSLHFMLSSSVDEWERGDSGVCSNLNTYKSRRIRSVEDGAKEEDKEEEGGEEEGKEGGKEGGEEGEKEEGKEGEKEEGNEGGKEGGKEGEKGEGVTSVEEGAGGGEAIPAKAEENRSSAEEIVKSIGEDVEKLPENEAEELTLKMKDALKRSGRLMSAPLPFHEVAKSGKAIADFPRSDCPVENGVIHTSYGAVSPGTLIAGVACGLQPESVTVAELLDNLSRGGRKGALSSSTDQVYNYWAATLAGDLAEAALYQGPHYLSISIGAAGGWNDTSVPKWYFLNQKDQLEMTDAEIRGGLDGLILAKKIKDWNNAFGNSLRLSQVLDMYYSDRGVSANPSYKACQRNMHFTEVAPAEEMKAQALASTKVLKDVQSYIPITDLMLNDFSDKAVSKLISYVPTMDPNLCPAYIGNMLPPTVSVDMVTIIDASWPYKDALTLLSYIIDQINLGEFGKEVGVGGGGGSAFTLISGQDANSPPIVQSSTSALDFYRNFTYDVYSKLTPGFNLLQVLTRLRSIYATSMETERARRVTTGRPQIALFIPYTSSVMSDSDHTASLNMYNRLRTKAPNTQFIYLSLGSKDPYSDFVINKDKDLFQISSIADFQSSVQPVLRRIAGSPRRIINPVCTYRWESKGENGMSTQYIDPMAGPQAFILQPNYFFKSDKVTIKFRGLGYGTLNICYSRKDDIIGSNSNSSSSSSSNGNSNSNSNCKSIQSETAEFSEDQPCSGTDYIGLCNPMYFTVSATSTNPRCFENNCRYPDMVPLELTHDGLGCASCAKGLLLSGVSVTLWFMLFSVKEALNRMLLIG